jgi:hypothetical protein|tara:strand:- start:44 stop:232 length:189 start_codon:yes stop_codon:yes gene_type:complete
MNEIKLTLRENEVSALFQLIDVAVKSQGLQVSEVATVIFNKLQEQAKEQWSEREEEEEEETE